MLLLAGGVVVERMGGSSSSDGATGGSEIIELFNHVHVTMMICPLVMSLRSSSRYSARDELWNLGSRQP